MNPTTNRRPVLRSDSFRSYLAAHQSQVVGRSAHEDACPIALWLSSLIGAPCEVTCDGYQVEGYDDIYPLPAWVRAFIRALDFTLPLDEVTGTQALALLNQVTCSPLGNGPARPLSDLTPFDGGQHVGPVIGVLL